MGVDFTGYSRVKSDPVPDRFRTKRKPVSEEDTKRFETKLLETPHDLRAFVMVMSGASYSQNGKVILPDVIEIAQELKDELYEIMEKEEDYICISWETNTIYRRTPETKQGSAGRSYSGYGDFRKVLFELNGGRLPYMPPDTNVAPENGIVSTERCITCLQGLERLKHHFVSPSFVADPEKYGISCDHRFSDKDVPAEDNINPDSWFFREFYSMMSVASDGGIVVIY